MITLMQHQRIILTDILKKERNKITKTIKRLIPEWAKDNERERLEAVDKMLDLLK